jgi:hypothetical protein
LGGPAWQASHAYTLGQIITPTSLNAGNYSFQVTTAGTSSGTQPNPWNQTLNANQSDGGVTWENIGNQDTTHMSTSGPILVLNAGVSGYNGQWTIAAIPTSTTITYTDTNTGLGASSGGNVVTHWNSGIEFYNNQTGGNWGSCPTSELFYEGSGSFNANATVFNNLFLATFGSGAMANGIVNISCNGGGSCYYLNNTMIGTNDSSNCLYLSASTSSVLTAKNNITASCNGQLYASNTGTSAIVAVDYDLYGGSTSGTPWALNCGGSGCSYSNFSGWQTLGYDAHGLFNSSTSYVKVNTNGTLQSGSPAINAGTNLSGLGITALDSDITGASRGSTWSMGAFNPSSSTITVSIYGYGTITSSPAGIACTATGTLCNVSATFNTGTSITLTAGTPGSNYVFSGFTGGCVASSSTCTFTITANTTVFAGYSHTYANFERASGHELDLVQLNLAYNHTASVDCPSYTQSNASGCMANLGGVTASLPQSIYQASFGGTPVRMTNGLSDPVVSTNQRWVNLIGNGEQNNTASIDDRFVAFGRVSADNYIFPLIPGPIPSLGPILWPAGGSHTRAAYGFDSIAFSGIYPGVVFDLNNEGLLYAFNAATDPQSTVAGGVPCGVLANGLTFQTCTSGSTGQALVDFTDTNPSGSGTAVNINQCFNSSSGGGRWSSSGEPFNPLYINQPNISDFDDSLGFIMSNVRNGCQDATHGVLDYQLNVSYSGTSCGGITCGTAISPGTRAVITPMYNNPGGHSYALVTAGTSASTYPSAWCQTSGCTPTTGGTEVWVEIGQQRDWGSNAHSGAGILVNLCGDQGFATLAVSYHLATGNGENANDCDVVDFGNGHSYHNGTDQGQYTWQMTVGGTTTVAQATGTVTTTAGATGACSAFCVTQVSGAATFPLGSVMAGLPITINSVSYTVASVQSGTLLTLTSSPGNQSSAVAYSYSAPPLFTLHEGYITPNSLYGDTGGDVCIGTPGHNSSSSCNSDITSGAPQNFQFYNAGSPITVYDAYNGGHNTYAWDEMLSSTTAPLEAITTFFTQDVQDYLLPLQSGFPGQAGCPINLAVYYLTGYACGNYLQYHGQFNPGQHQTKNYHGLPGNDAGPLMLGFYAPTSGYNGYDFPFADPMVFEKDVYATDGSYNYPIRLMQDNNSGEGDFATRYGTYTWTRSGNYLFATSDDMNNFGGTATTNQWAGGFCTAGGVTSQCANPSGTQSAADPTCGPNWVPGQTYAAGSVILPLLNNPPYTDAVNSCTFKTVAGGTAGATAPTWQADLSGGSCTTAVSITDGTITWVPVQASECRYEVLGMNLNYNSQPVTTPSVNPNGLMLSEDVH